MSRNEFDRKTKSAAWERSGGHCEGVIDIDSGIYLPNPLNHPWPTKRCNVSLFNKPYHFDHIDPDWISGKSSLDNCQVLCRQCHAAKTRADVRAIAKIKRIRDKASGALQSRNVIPGSRRSFLKKRMDGKVERRS